MKPVTCDLCGDVIPAGRDTTIEGYEPRTVCPACLEQLED
jgi:formylmethanofuran dehydrogenase subunit E